MVDTSTVVYVVGIIGVVITARYLMSQNEMPRPNPRHRLVTEEMIDVVHVIVPQVDRDTIKQDLMQTHNIEATITRLLDRIRAGTLPVADAPVETRPSPASRDSLLRRYKLCGDEPIPETSKGWKDSREERESQLRAQREAMILRARNKLRTT